ncbi:MAG: hypothetical protein FJY98_00585 [Candidatus Liptonbacteria bacterium]|nr:hypothetical protein [Candidatus Liptonbacteria bacterium]
MTGFSWTGFINSKTNKGNLVHTQYGPKAEPSKSYNVPTEIQWLDPSQMAGGPDRMKGTHTNSGWHNEDKGVMETVKHTADARTELTVTGESNKKYNVRLRANAVEWHLGTVLTAIGVQFIDKPIPCSVILLRGSPLDANCEISLSLSPGTYDVTPSVPGRYIYSVDVVDIVWSPTGKQVPKNVAEDLRTRVRDLRQRLAVIQGQIEDVKRARR